MLWLIVGLIVGFAGGVLFGRRNKVKVEKVVAIAKDKSLTAEQKIKALLALLVP